MEVQLCDAKLLTQAADQSTSKEKTIDKIPQNLVIPPSWIHILNQLAAPKLHATALLRHPNIHVGELVSSVVQARKTRDPEENPLEQRTAPTKNSTHSWHQQCDSNQGHISGRHVFSTLQCPCTPVAISKNNYYSFKIFLGF